MHRGMWEKRRMKSVGAAYFLQIGPETIQRRALSWPEKSDGSGLPIAASISATASSHRRPEYRVSAWSSVVE